MRVPPKAPILLTDTPPGFEAAVHRAAELLRAGELVALPTETVYGLAANALDPAAVAKIFEVKGRPTHNPIIVHVASIGMAKDCARNWPRRAARLAEAFWPGPLTMVLPKADLIPEIVTAGGGTVGIRWPSHKFMQAVIQRCDFPLAAPSANLANRVSPTQAGHVQKQLGDRIPLIVDGGISQVGIESTVVDLTATRARILRPGMIHEESLVAALGEELGGGDDGGKPDQTSALRSPGCLPRHYSPKAKLVLLSWQGIDDFLAQLAHCGVVRERTWLMTYSLSQLPPSFLGMSLVPHDATAYARALYAELHRSDEAGAEWIVVEQPPKQPGWRGIADRLARAALR